MLPVSLREPEHGARGPMGSPENAEQRLSRGGECVRSAPGVRLTPATPAARLHPAYGPPPMRHHERG